MKVNELIFKGADSIGYSFIRQCLFKDEWQDHAAEYNNAVKQLISDSANTDEFAEKYLAHTEWKREQCYQAMLKQYKPDDVWSYIREMFGDKSRKTISDAGALKIGSNGFEILIPNGYGDGETHYAVLNCEEFYASDLMTYFTMINGKFTVFSYDCGDDIKEKLEGSYRIYYYERLIALVDMNQTEEQEHKYSPEIEELVNNIAACSDWAEANNYIDRLIYLAANKLEPYSAYNENYNADAEYDVVFYLWFEDNCFGVMDNYCQPLDMSNDKWEKAKDRYERLKGEEIIHCACVTLGVNFDDLL